MTAREVRNLVFLYKSFAIFQGILHVETRNIDESLNMLYVLKSS
jgi:hypothetical protein